MKNVQIALINTSTEMWGQYGRWDVSADLETDTNRKYSSLAFIRNVLVAFVVDSTFKSVFVVKDFVISILNSPVLEARRRNSYSEELILARYFPLGRTH